MRLTAPVAISPAHDLSWFDCGVPVLNDWLRERALKNESRFSRTYVVCDGARVAGYFCLSAGAVQREAAPGKLRRNAPDSVPVSIIGRLAVDREYGGQGLGANLLADALRRIVGAAQSIGIAAVLVQAKDETARAWYLAQAEWLEFPAGSRTLWLPVGMVMVMRAT
ncbi:GNAT family N-acetyltransferase [Rhodobacter sp. SY28-1]|uniref:GNAT family N-acetyltransferase n=1 Tax=Rhodobacter sp. SY28-1 TaxID=2562317 RepID=UPI0010C028C7|nr:GNAT family N-acetyltransferase [Rhodobacter sp. SY28-1]